MGPRDFRVVIGAIVAAMAAAAVQAGEVTAVFALGLRGAMQEIAPAFEAASGHALRVSFDPPGIVAKRFSAGERIDVVALPRDAMQSLERDGVLAGSPEAVAVGRMGIGVKPGAARPDISSKDQFKAALLAARTITHSDPARGGAGALNSIAAFSEMHIADEMKAKTIYPREHSPAGIAREVKEGRAELASNLVHEIVEAGLDLAGPFPDPLGKTIMFAVAPTTTGADKDAARSLVTFLHGAQAVRIFAAHGLAPPD